MLKEMLAAAIALGYTIVVYDPSEDDADYVGDNLMDIMDAIDGVDEIEIDIVDTATDDVDGWAMIVNDLPDDERIADCSGWVSDYMDRN